jgi:hypothetical protein
MGKAGCRGCRLSKVKCDLEACPTGHCTRCARLGLACIPNPPSQQGRRKIQDTTARLSPAVRALLLRRPPEQAEGAAATAAGDADDAARRAEVAQHARAIPRMPMAAFAATAVEVPQRWHWWEVMCEQLKTASRTSRMAIVRQTFVHAKSTSCWNLANDVMPMARMLDLSLDDAMLAIGEATSQFSKNLMLGMSEPPQLPDYIAEWHHHSIFPVVTNVDYHGTIRKQPNKVFQDAWASVHGGDMSGLDAMTGVARGDLRRQDGAWLALLETPSQRALVTAMFLKLWTAIDRDVERAQHMELPFNELDEPVRFVLNGQPTAWLRPKLRCYAANYGTEVYLACAYAGFGDCPVEFYAQRHLVAPTLAAPSPVLVARGGPTPRITEARSNSTDAQSAEVSPLVPVAIARWPLPPQPAQPVASSLHTHIDLRAHPPASFDRLGVQNDAQHSLTQQYLHGYAQCGGRQNESNPALAYPSQYPRAAGPVGLASTATPARHLASSVLPACYALPMASFGVLNSQRSLSAFSGEAEVSMRRAVGASLQATFPEQQPGALRCGMYSAYGDASIAHADAMPMMLHSTLHPEDLEQLSELMPIEHLLELVASPK